MAREDEKSSRTVVRCQSAVPCVGRAIARDPHTKDTVEEATRDSGRGSLRDGPSSRDAATRDHASRPLSRKTADTTEHTLLHPQAPRTRQEFKRCAHTQGGTHKTAQRETPTCAWCSCLLFQVRSVSAGRFFWPLPSCARPDVTSASTSPTSTPFSSQVWGDDLSSVFTTQVYVARVRVCSQGTLHWTVLTDVNSACLLIAQSHGAAEAGATSDKACGRRGF